MAGRPFLADAQSAALLAVHGAGLRPAAVQGARRHGAAQAVRRRVRHVPVRAIARHALRRRPARGDRVRLRDLLRGLAAVAADQRLPAAAVAADRDRAGAAAPGPLPAAGLAALVALQFFGGHPETSFHFLFADRRLLRPAADPARGGRSDRPDRPPDVRTRPRGRRRRWRRSCCSRSPSCSCTAPTCAHRQDSAPTQLDERFLGAFFLNDYWGRPTQTPLVPFVSNRGLYAGGITLMLGAVGLVLRPKATRVGFAVFAGFILVAVMGLQPFAWFLRLPGFASAHNGRMVVFVLFALAMLAGWGLDELSSRSRGVPAPQRRARGGGRPLLRAACVDARRRHAPPRPAQARAQAGLAVRPTSARSNPLAAVSGATVATIRLSALLQWLPLAGAGLAADRAFACSTSGRAAGSLPAGRLRRAGGRGAGGRPVPRQHGLQPGDPDRPRRAARHGRHPLPAVADARTASPASTPSATSTRCRPTSRSATASTTRAATTTRSSSATTPGGGRRPGRPSSSASRPPRP